MAMLRAAVLDGAALDEVMQARRFLDALLDDVRADLAPLAGRASVELKSDGTPVTPHDRATDVLLTSRLLEAFPSHGVISEEAGHVAPGGDWTWVIDPIDGTSNFIAGLPYWCVSVALCLEGAPALGVIEAPALSQRFTAIAGRGAEERVDGRVRRLQVGGRVDLRDPSASYVPGLYSGGAARDLTTDGVTLNARIMGAAALDLAMVANGTSPLSVTLGPHVWDVAAGGLLVVEAGGACAAATARPLLPLVAGRDYGAEVVRTAGAVDEDTAREALASVSRGRAARRADAAVRAQSWAE
jgi:fructose-1,6-bisphosphatase/inositol monophosphatase family enzyme